MKVLIDGNNLVYRYFYIKPDIENYTINCFNRLIDRIKENYFINEKDIIFVFDDFNLKNPRRTMYPEYKNNRAKKNPLLKEQLRKLMEMTRCKTLKSNKLEADDIIATLCKVNSQKQKPERIIVMSNDKDLYSIIDNNVSIVRDLKFNEIMNKETFEKMYKIPTEKWVYVKGLKGDDSDNIPGVKGIGEKTALSITKKERDFKAICNHVFLKYGEKGLNDFKIAYSLVTPIIDIETVKNIYNV